MADKAIEVLLDEKRNFPPPKEFQKSAHARSKSVYNTARKNPQAFWAKAAKELHWFKPWKKVLEWNSPWAKWFVGGKINASYNCLDRHVKTARSPKSNYLFKKLYPISEPSPRKAACPLFPLLFPLVVVVQDYDG